MKISLKQRDLVYVFVGIISLILLVFTIILLFSKSSTSTQGLGTNVTFSDGTQIISMSANGGFVPTETTAKSGVSTILRVSTENTYDCSSTIKIPKLGITKNLPTDGITDIEIPAQESGTTISGTCSSGTYHFTVRFI